MKEPVDHILRPQLPWRTDGGITECGYNAEKISTLTREAWFARVKELGLQRSAMLTCMTCSQTAGRWVPWEVDPRSAVHREIEWEGYRNGYYHSHRDKRGFRLHDELLAIAALIERHRDEFDAHVLATEQRRDWLEKKAANEAGKQNARVRGRQL